VASSPARQMKLIRLALLLLALHCAAPAAAEARLWIDTDPGCDDTATQDVDDCLAIAAIALSGTPRVAGISTVFGNVSRERADASLSRLIRLWPGVGQASTPAPVPGARRNQDCADNAAAAALGAALDREPLVVLALGPMTNIACMLADRPSRAERLVRVVAVMGARPGHVFHPSEDRSAQAVLWHGPIMRDLNVQLDPESVASVLQSGAPLTLVPYEVAREVEIHSDDLDRLAERGALGSEVAEQARPWLSMWQRVIGREGFYPFDLFAVAQVLRPDALRCSPLQAHVTADRAISGNTSGPKRLLVGSLPWADDDAGVDVQWCNQLAASGRAAVLGLLR
jgi:purine nucleosidase